MRAMTFEQARNWCLRVGLKVTSDDELHYVRSKQLKFFVEAPEEFRSILFLTGVMLSFSGVADFSGGLLWLRRWDIGGFARVGWRIIEGIRQAHGDSRSLEVAPGQAFREDEGFELQALLLQVIGFGWVAEFVPSSGGFFLHFKDNRQVCFTADSPETLKELRATFSEWNPTKEDPMVIRMAELEREHQNREEAVVRAFIVPTKRRRYLEFLSSPRKRTKFTSQLAHFKDLNPKFVVGIPSNQQDPAAVAKLLVAKGAGSRCWLISEDPEVDGREMDLETALKRTIGRQMGTFISCVPGKLAYFEDEDERCILER